MTLVDLSGYSFSGKSAVFDLLHRQNMFDAISIDFEFELIRGPGGILELRDAISGPNWSPIRSSEAIRRYLRLVWLLGGKGCLMDRLTRLGCHYDQYFNNFTELSKQYVERLLVAKWESPWPSAKYQYSDLKIIYKKISSRFGYRDNHKVYFTRLSQDEFDSYTKEYLDALISSRQNKGTKLLLSNAFEPFQPAISINLFSKAKCIIVDRDPRDIYLSARLSANSNGSRVGQAVIGNSVYDFVERFLLYREAINLNADNANVLRITFEDLVKNFESIRKCLCDFLEFSDNGIDVNKSDFNPVKSSKNVGIWKKMKDSKEIKLIEKELKDYLYTSN